MRTRNRGFSSLLTGLLFVPALLAGCVPPAPPAYPPDDGGGGGGRIEQPATPYPETDSADAESETADAVAVVDGFWTAHWSDTFTGSYQNPTVSGPYDETTAPLCGGEPLPPENAVYCQEGYVAWDAGWMAAGYSQLDDTFVFTIIAHEWGHAIQAQLDPAIVAEAKELQADCLAGAALSGAEQDGTFVFEEGDAEGLAAVFSYLGDDTPWYEDGDHGDPEQRAEQFLAGYGDGVGACLPAQA
jgi:predicted metalloprotease